MARGNALLKQLVQDRDDRPRSVAVRSEGAIALRYRRTAGRALALTATTLLAGAAAWAGMNAAVSDAGDWPGLETNLAGLAGAAIAVTLILFGARRPLSSPIAGFALAIGQGVCFAWLSVAFDAAIPGLIVNALLGTVLAGLAAPLVGKCGVRPRILRVLIATGAALVALTLVAVSASAAGIDLGLFGNGDGLPWHVWLVALILVTGTAYSFDVDLELVGAYVESGGENTWAAAAGVAAGLTGMYAWRFFADLTKGHSDDSPSGASADSYADYGD